MATGEIPIRRQLLDNGSPPNQIPASKLPITIAPRVITASRSSVAGATGKTRHSQRIEKKA